MAPPMPTGAADEAPSPFSLKRGTAEDEAKALLAEKNSDLIKMYPTMFEAAEVAAKEANAASGKGA